MIYYLKHKNKIVATFDLAEEVKSCSVNLQNSAYLPLSVKKMLMFKDAYIAEETAYNLIANEEGCYLLERWLNDREIPINRDNRKKYLSNTSARMFMLENHACSLTDCYWICKQKDNSTWDDVKLFNLTKIEDQLFVEHSPSYSGTNATLGGQLEKYWYVDDNGDLNLCKKERNTNVIVLREVFASKIYKNLQSIPYCDYSLVKNHYQEVVGCSCKAFTSEQFELVTAYELLEEMNYTQRDDVYEKIIERAVYYGLEENEVRRYLDTQTIVDFLITNRDRHQGNIGFIRNSDSLLFVSTAPVYDSGSSRFMEREHPETLTATSVNGLYNTEMECLSHVKDFSCVNVARLPSSEEYRELLAQSTENAYRINSLCEMYEQKINWLKEKQLQNMNLF